MRVIDHLPTQENMMQGRFDGEKFHYSLFLVFCNRILACVVAVVALLVRAQHLAALSLAGNTGVYSFRANP